MVDLVLTWVEEAFDGDLMAASTLALARLQRTSMGAETLLAEVGVEIIDLLYRRRRVYPQRWRAVRQAGNGHHIGENLERPAGPATPVPHGSLAGAEGDRGASSVLRSIQEVPPDPPVYAAWFTAEGRWFQLGDMTRREAEFLEHWYVGQADGYTKRGAFFARVRDLLDHGEQTVRERLTPEAIHQIAREVGIAL